MTKEQKPIVANTVQIADLIKCPHHKVCKRIDSYLKEHPEQSENFIEAKYEALTNRFHRMYNLTNDGLKIYLKMRYEDAGRNSPQTMAGLQQVGKLLQGEEPLTGEEPGENGADFQKEASGQIMGVDDLYQLYRDRANSRPDPRNVRVTEEECEKWARSASANGGQELGRIMESVYEYGDSRERNGYVAGFYMALRIALGLYTFSTETVKEC